MGETEVQNESVRIRAKIERMHQAELALSEALEALRDATATLEALASLTKGSAPAAVMLHVRSELPMVAARVSKRRGARTDTGIADRILRATTEWTAAKGLQRALPDVNLATLYAATSKLCNAIPPKLNRRGEKGSFEYRRAGA